MNKRQAKKYEKKINATTNSTVEEHKSGEISNTKRIKRRGAHNKYYIPIKRRVSLKPQVEEHKSEEISNTKRIKHYTTVLRQRFPKPQVKLAKKRVRLVPEWRKRLGTAPQDEPVETAEPLEE